MVYFDQPFCPQIIFSCFCQVLSFLVTRFCCRRRDGFAFNFKNYTSCI
ncbi:hypothetical protein SynPROSU1_01529 [Synechococcus sp. PROS-U-1]|nr:hypothetical protein SynPROSU1_01529 [Synechococcus sp. PROS-U-1]